MRWDPTDPAQRRARYALLSGMWAFFFSLFGWRDLALLLGALALYWGISSLRAKPGQPDPKAAATGTAAQSAGGLEATGSSSGSDSGAGAGAGSGVGPAAGPAWGAGWGPGAGASAGAGPVRGAGIGTKPQRTAAVSGLVTASLALAMVAMTFTAQLVYSDYYTCVNDALTTSAKHSCDHLLPKELRTILGTEP